MNRIALLLLMTPAAMIARADAVDDIVNQVITTTKTPGVAIAIVKDGKVERTKGFGVADVEHGVPVTADTRFQIGSVSKQFAATLIMSLVEEGKIALSDPISKHLPDLPEAWRTATVQQLLQHTSGIPSYTDLQAFGKLIPTPATDKGLIDLAASSPLVYKHGEKWAYNNTGYYLLGMIVEKLSGKSFDAVLQERICGPLQMGATRMNSWSAVIPNRARGYEIKDGKVENAMYLDMGWPGAAGAMISSVNDLAKWALAQEKAILKPDTWKTLLTTTVKTGDGSAEYAFGWGRDIKNKIPIIEHGGGIPGFTCQVLRVPTKSLTVIVLTNSESSNPGSMATRIAEHFVPEMKSAVNAVADPTPEVTARLKSVFAAALKGEMKEDDFEGPLKDRIFPNGKNMLKDAFGPQATIKSFTLTKAEDKEGAKQREYLIDLGVAKVKTTFVVAANGKITGFMVQPA